MQREAEMCGLSTHQCHKTASMESIQQLESIKRVCPFDVADSPFKCRIGALMWLSGTLENLEQKSLLTY